MLNNNMATTLCRILKETLVKSNRVPAVYAHTLHNAQKSDSTSLDGKSTNQRDVSSPTQEEQSVQAHGDSKMIYRANTEIKGAVPEFTGNALGLEHHEALTNKETKEPFMTGVIHMTPQFGQMLNPHVIPSTKEKRLIACLCDEDSDKLHYMWLHRGEPQRCMCGIFFRLEEVDNFGDPI
ncbi:cytochrome c oxidase subunit 5B, mitochondrial-like [Crassostrea virginica]|uniref:Cytochrome c oxidase subunit 5B, mitochondrial-like n=1 Tax=Crassostrea virginica TaxID=6565 RepID=A0A8B8CS27_CRAVI|nr:cytochrome c oxidase subunit 5B, mitochondrial-like [Crassostrea virginica]